MKNLRLVCAAAVALSFSLSAHAVTVFLENFPAAPNELTDPSHVTLPNGTYATLPNKGDADLGAGTFRSYMDGSLTTGIASAMYSGIANTDPLVLTNNTVSPITIAAGALSAHVSGTYSITPVPNGSGSAQVNTGLHINVCSFYNCDGTYDAYANSQSIWGFDAQGNVIPSVTRFTSGVTETGGGHTNITHAGLDGITADLLMPEIVINPGEFMLVSFILMPAAPGKTAIADFYTEGASLSLVLPEGVTLDSNAAVPLTWLTTVPVPGAAWLFGAALAGFA